MSSTKPIWWRRAAGLRGITRHFLVDQMWWRAFEYPIGTAPVEINLVFACQTAWRRLRKFPADWATQGDSQLVALSGF